MASALMNTWTNPRHAAPRADISTPSANCLEWTRCDGDFSYALNLPVEGDKTHIHDFDPQALRHRPIATGEHCFGCTAGARPLCGGVLT
jgi:hypothetical protein